MKILQIHNRYQLGWGGEDSVIENERQLLTDNGHQVDLRFVETTPQNTGSVMGLARTSINSIYSFPAKAWIQKQVEEVRPDVVHVHNTFPLLSPSIYHQLSASKTPCVLTLHNYRLVCANALFLRDGKVCTLCLDSSRKAAIKYRCYKNSLLGSWVQVETQQVHDWLSTYRDKVDSIIVLSDFARQIFLRAGLPATKLHVKPNFLPVSSPLTGIVRRPNVFLFIGKIVQEKGIERLLNVWKQLSPASHELWIVGDGPEKEDLQSRFSDAPHVTWYGWKNAAEVHQLAAQASWLVVPSIWFEGFPMVLLEAFQEGTPAIVPNLGAMPEVVDNEQRGLIYDGTEAGLANAIEKAMAIGEAEREKLGQNCQEAIAGEYSPERNLQLLLGAYEAAIAAK